MATVDTEKKHWECRKCKNVKSNTDYSTKKVECREGGYCDWKVVQASWDKSLLGATVNLVGKGVKAGASKAAEYKSEEA